MIRVGCLCAATPRAPVHNGVLVCWRPAAAAIVGYYCHTVGVSAKRRVATSRVFTRVEFTGSRYDRHAGDQIAREHEAWRGIWACKGYWTVECCHRGESSRVCEGKLLPQ